jgi:hypothetical protein
MLGSLYLFPLDPEAPPPDPTGLVLQLRHLELLDEAIPEGGYRAGPELLSWISFTGCSPAVLLADPGDGRSFTRVRVLGPFPRPRLLAQSGRSRPRCPHCRAGVSGWQQLLPEWHAHPQQSWICPRCQQATPAVALDWRHYGARGRLLVEITGIFPGEASPVPSLLDTLQAATGVCWDYAWGPDSSHQ